MVPRHVRPALEAALSRQCRQAAGQVAQELLRDSGLLHALLGVETVDDLLGHPVVGVSWEGFVIENLIAASPNGTHVSSYRTSAGAEIDLLLKLGGRRSN